MCGHCGCHGVDAVRELEEEHAALVEQAHDVRRALAAGEPQRAADLVRGLVGHLHTHVRREETGIFAALRSSGEFLEEVAELEGEHRHLDAGIDGLDPDAPDFAARVAALLGELEEHIEREDLGIFPVSVVTLGAAGWELVDRAHAEVPSFLTGSAP